MWRCQNFFGENFYARTDVLSSTMLISWSTSKQGDGGADNVYLGIWETELWIRRKKQCDDDAGGLGLDCVYEKILLLTLFSFTWLIDVSNEYIDDLNIIVESRVYVKKV